MRRHRVISFRKTMAEAIYRLQYSKAERCKERFREGLLQTDEQRGVWQDHGEREESD